LYYKTEDEETRALLHHYIVYGNPYVDEGSQLEIPGETTKKTFRDFNLQSQRADSLRGLLQSKGLGHGVKGEAHVK